MAHIPFDDVRQLFNENKSKSWSGFRQVLQQHMGKTDDIEDSIITSLILITQQLEQSKEPYPSSPEQMQRILDNVLSRVTV